MRKVLELVCGQGLARVYLVDDQQRPRGVITLADLLTEFYLFL